MFFLFFRLQVFLQAVSSKELGLHLSRQQKLSDRPESPEPVSALQTQEVPQDGDEERRYKLIPEMDICPGFILALILQLRVKLW